MASESFFRPAAVMPLRRLADFVLFAELSPPRRRAQRAFAAATNFARVAADMRRRPREPRPVDDFASLPPNKELSRCSKE